MRRTEITGAISPPRYSNFQGAVMPQSWSVGRNEIDEILMKKLRFSLCLLLVWLSVGFGQEASEKIVVHELVGNEIDKIEREKYGLFPSVDNFYSATFLRNDSNSIVLKLESVEQGEVVSQTLPATIFLLENIAGQIERISQSSVETEASRLETIEKERRRGKELFPGYAGSLFGGWITVLFVYGLNPGHDPSKAEFYVVWGLGSALFCALGVQAAGEFDDGSRTLGASFLGGLAGSALGILAFEGSLRVENPGVAALVILFAKPLLTSYGAIRGYYSAAKSKYTGAVNLDKSGLRFGIPAENFQMVQESPFVGQPFLTYKISLLNVSLR